VDPNDRGRTRFRRNLDFISQVANMIFTLVALFRDISSPFHFFFFLFFFSVVLILTLAGIYLLYVTVSCSDVIMSFHDSFPLHKAPLNALHFSHFPLLLISLHLPFRETLDVTWIISLGYRKERFAAWVTTGNGGVALSWEVERLVNERTGEPIEILGKRETFGKKSCRTLTFSKYLHTSHTVHFV
jgi:hypothetical protein